jgi:hypothetical protein
VRNTHPACAGRLATELALVFAISLVSTPKMPTFEPVINALLCVFAYNCRPLALEPKAGVICPNFGALVLASVFDHKAIFILLKVN